MTRTNKMSESITRQPLRKGCLSLKKPWISGGLKGQSGRRRGEVGRRRGQIKKEVRREWKKGDESGG